MQLRWMVTHLLRCERGQYNNKSIISLYRRPNLYCKLFIQFLPPTTLYFYFLLLCSSLLNYIVCVCLYMSVYTEGIAWKALFAYTEEYYGSSPPQLQFPQPDRWEEAAAGCAPLLIDKEAGISSALCLNETCLWFDRPQLVLWGHADHH